MQNPATIQKNTTKIVEDLHNSQSYYDSLVQSDPMNSTAWVVRGNYYNDVNNQYETALQNYDRALELDPANGYAWYSKGITLQNLHRINESETSFEIARRYGFDK
jgi:tetratricopeptide (TPR) repeat protein